MTPATDHQKSEPCDGHGQGSSFWSSKPLLRNTKQPRISATAIEKGIQESYGIISICLSQIPGIFLAIVAIKTVIRDKLGGQEFARASYFIIFPFPILKSFAMIKDMKWLIGLRHVAEKLFPQKSIDLQCFTVGNSMLYLSSIPIQICKLFPDFLNIHFIPLHSLQCLSKPWI